MAQVEMGEGVIERDVRCIGCKYNLRGLEVGGRCPECGREIMDSVMADAQRERRRLRQQRNFFVAQRRILKLFSRGNRHQFPELPLAQASMVWRREIVEAAILMVIALAWPLVGLPVSGWLVDWKVELRSGHHGAFGKPLLVRAGYLACYCVPWALAALAMWKVSVREFVRPRFKQDRARGRIAIRFLTVLWFVAPVVINLWSYGPNIEGAWFVLATVPLSLLFFYRLRAVAVRAGESELGGQFLAIAWVSALFSFVGPVLGSAGLNRRSAFWADEVFALLPFPGGGMTWFLAWFKDYWLPIPGGLMVALALWECAALIGLAVILRKGLKIRNGAVACSGVGAPG